MYFHNIAIKICIVFQHRLVNNSATVDILRFFYVKDIAETRFINKFAQAFYYYLRKIPAAEIAGSEDKGVHSFVICFVLSKLQ